MEGNDKLIRLQIARTGTFGASGNQITSQDLQDVVDSFDGRCPVSLGHYMARQDWWPCWGNVENLQLVEADGDNRILVGDVSVKPELWEAIKTGFYPGWSVSIPPRASDGKRYLHHLAFLGSTPPAIRDLKILASADGSIPEDSILVERDNPAFGFSDQAIYSASDFADAPTEILASGEEKEEETGEPDFKDDGKASGKVVEKARAIYSRSIKDSLDKAVEGRLPAGMNGKLHEFADLALSSFDFADEEEEPRILKLFKEIVSSMDRLPAAGRMNFSDVGSPEEKVDMAELARRF